MNTAAATHQPTYNGNASVELHSRLKTRLKRAEEIAGQMNLIPNQQRPSIALTHTTMNTVSAVDDEFPPPPPELLLPVASPSAVTTSNSTQSSLLAEIQRGSFKLRKTMIEKDRSAPRFK
jgi:hypothetical protein